MSSSQHANAELNLITQQICWLVTRSNKLKVGDPAAKTFAHQIAMTLATAFTQHGNAATSLVPLLLSCAAKIQDKSGPNGKLKALPDWNAISDDDDRIQNHHLFPKTIGYQYPSSTPPPPATPPPAPQQAAPLTPSPTIPAPNLHTCTPSPAPPVTIIPKHKLFVLGNVKRRASTPKPKDNAVEDFQPATKKQKTETGRHQTRVPQMLARAHPKKVKSKPFIIDDEEEEQVPANKAIVVKRKVDAGPSAQPTATDAAKSNVTKLDDESSKDGAPAEDTGMPCLFGAQCEWCIKDDIPCTVILGQKQGEVWKCCCNCDTKKTKCIHPTPEQDALLWAAVALKKTKAVNKKMGPAKRTWSKAPVSTRATRTASHIHMPSPMGEKLSDEDAEGEDDSRPVETPATCVAPPPVDEKVADILPKTVVAPLPSYHVDNDVNMDFIVQEVMPTLPVKDAWEDIVVQQPSNLDIIQSILTMHCEFVDLLQRSGDRSEVVHQEMDIQVTDLEDHWEIRFAAMEKKMREVDIQATGNAVSIGHMVSAMKTLTQTGDVSAFEPPVGPSTQGHPFGQIPSSWLPQLPHSGDSGRAPDPSISAVGKLFTTAWDESRGPVAGGPEKRAGLMVEGSTNHTGLTGDSQLSSVSSSGSIPKD
ncbi:hypothetical protein EV702DRAFT_1253446 [Suillus placidus]|uniref:Uncharacterized protein n=1 Tax=Suillus placidus TaxID=48579 RepID=A0A9P7CY42_9AGAM|nr:hypothetical protein EV702DRAFT_1253446 [Suillus placidus]